MKFDFSLIPNATLFLMMLALGMTLTLLDFRRLLQQPKPVAIGMSGQLLLLPGLAFVLILVLPLAPATALGIALLAACPGGTVSNMFSHYAKGDVALSVSLTAMSSVVAPFTIPLILVVAINWLDTSAIAVTFSKLKMVLSLCATTILPMVLGMLWKKLNPRSAEKLSGPLMATASIILLFLIIGLGVNTLRMQQGDISGLLSRSLLAVTLLITLSAAGMLALSALLRLGTKGRTTLLLEVGLQNINLALVVVNTFLKDQQLLGPTLVYLPIMLIFAATVTWLGRRAHD